MRSLAQPDICGIVLAADRPGMALKAALRGALLAQAETLGQAGPTDLGPHDAGPPAGPERALPDLVLMALRAAAAGRAWLALVVTADPGRAVHLGARLGLVVADGALSPSHRQPSPAAPALPTRGPHALVLPADLDRARAWELVQALLAPAAAGPGPV